MSNEPAVHGSGPVFWTIENAATHMAAREGWHQGARDSLVSRMVEGAEAGVLVVRDPHTDLPYRPSVIRTFYDLVLVSDVDAWLQGQGVTYRLGQTRATRATGATGATEKLERKRGITSVAGLNVRYPHPTFQVGIARWSLWGQMRTAELWQALALSLNKDPIAFEDLPGEGYIDPEVVEAYGGEEFSRRLLVASDAMGGPLKLATATDEVAEPGRVRVGLEDFAAWAESLTPPWKLPREFPRHKAIPESIATPPGSPNPEESREERCTRLLQWFRTEEAKEKRGALARVAQRDGRRRQTVKADIDAAIRAKSPAADAMGMVTRTYKQR